MRKSSVDVRGGAVVRGVFIVGRVGAGLVCGLGVWGLGFGVWGLGFGVWGLGFGVRGWGFEAHGAHLRLVVVLQLLHNLPNNYHNAKV